jgi:hypothetical protein
LRRSLVSADSAEEEALSPTALLAPDSPLANFASMLPPYIAAFRFLYRRAASSRERRPT